MLHVDTVKFLADGGLSGATAALSVDYRHTPTHAGCSASTTTSSPRSAARATTPAGASPRTPSATSPSTRCSTSTKRSGRVRAGSAIASSTWACPSAAQLARAARLGVVAAPQAIFLYSLGRNFRDYLPDALLPRCYPLRAMLDAGVTVALSSDAPVVENDNPLAGITAAVTRRDRAGQPLVPEQAITAAEALDAYTRGGAVAVGLAATCSAPSRRARAPIWPCCPAIPSPLRPTSCRPSPWSRRCWPAACVYERP